MFTTLYSALLAQLIFLSVFSNMVTTAYAEGDGPEQLGARNKLKWIDYRRLNLYAGLSWVRSQNSEATVRSAIESELGGSLKSFAVNQNRLGGHIGFGYEFTDNFHLELMYYNFGQVNVESAVVGFSPGSLEEPMSNNLPWTGSGANIDAKFNMWVVNPYHRLFARIGVLNWSSAYNIADAIEIYREGTSVTLGAGYEYFYRKGRSIRAQTTVGKVGDETLIALGAAYVIYFDGLPREPMPIYVKPPEKDEEDDDAIVYFALDKLKRDKKIADETKKIEKITKGKSDDEIVYFAPEKVQRDKKSKDDGNLLGLGAFGLIPIGAQVPIIPASSPLILLGSFGTLLNFVVYFDFDKDNIKIEAEKTLKEIVRYLKRHPDLSVVLTGHTDAVSSEKYNIGLSLRRIQAVKKYLAEEDISSEKVIDSKYFGKSYPSFKNDTYEGRRRNRRVHICISPSDKASSLDCRGGVNYSSIQDALIINQQEVNQSENRNIKNQSNENNNLNKNSIEELKILCSLDRTERSLSVLKRQQDNGCLVKYREREIASAADWNYCKRVTLNIINNLEDANYLCKGL